MRAAAQVPPAQRAAGRVQVVVDGQLGSVPGTDLDRLARFELRRAGRVALEPDQLELVRLGRELNSGLLVGHDPAGEPLALLDDLAHPALDRLQVLRGERRLDVEVVVEPVLHGRADTQLGLREQLLHGLRHDVRGRMPHDVPAVVAGVIHRLDKVTVGDLAGQIAQFAVDPGGDDAGWQGTGLAGKGRARGRASLDHMLATCEGDTKLLAGHGVLLDGRIAYRKSGYPMLSARSRIARVSIPGDQG